MGLGSPLGSLHVELSRGWSVCLPASPCPHCVLPVSSLCPHKRSKLRAAGSRFSLPSPQDTTFVQAANRWWEPCHPAQESLLSAGLKTEPCFLGEKAHRLPGGGGSNTFYPRASLVSPLLGERPREALRPDHPLGLPAPLTASSEQTLTLAHPHTFTGPKVLDFSASTRAEKVRQVAHSGAPQHLHTAGSV